MKILHVITSLLTGGAEKLMVDLLPNLSDEGNNVELLLFNGIETDFYKQLINKGIKIHQLSIANNVYNPWLIFKLSRFLIQNKYDIIHTHNTSCQIYTLIAAQICNVKAKLVTTEHNTSNRRRNKPYLKPLDRWMYRSYDKIISVSDQAERNLMNYLGPGYSITTIYNGIDISKFTSSENVIDNNHIVVTMVAGFRYEKDQDTLIKAISMLPSNYFLQLVGDGQRREEITQLISRYNLDKRVSLLGVRNDIPEILAKSDIIVQSSHFEGLSLSNLEGMASGRPFIASDVDGLREVTENAGILFKHEDAKDLSEKIRMLIEDNDLYNEIARKCRFRAQQYDIKIMSRKYNSIYKELIK